MFKSLYYDTSLAKDKSHNNNIRIMSDTNVDNKFSAHDAFME